MTPPQIQKQRSWSKTTPERSCWVYVAFEVCYAALWKEFSVEADGREPAAVVPSGNIRVAVAGIREHGFGGCSSVFDRLGHSLNGLRAATNPTSGTGAGGTAGSRAPEERGTKWSS